MEQNNSSHGYPSFLGFKSLIAFILSAALLTVAILLSGGLGSLEHIAIVALLSAAFAWLVWTVAAWLPFNPAQTHRLRLMLSGGTLVYVLLSNIIHPELNALEQSAKTFFGVEFAIRLPLLGFVLGALIALSLQRITRRLSH